jgi:hypothetical protein
MMMRVWFRASLCLLLAGCSGTANTQVDANVQANTQVNQNQTTIINQTIIQQQQQNVAVVAPVQAATPQPTPQPTPTPLSIPVEPFYTDDFAVFMPNYWHQRVADEAIVNGFKVDFMASGTLPSGGTEIIHVGHSSALPDNNGSVHDYYAKVINNALIGEFAGRHDNPWTESKLSGQDASMMTFSGKRKDGTPIIGVARATIFKKVAYLVLIQATPEDYAERGVIYQQVLDRFTLRETLPSPSPSASATP